MAIVFASAGSYLIDHGEFIRKLFSKVSNSNDCVSMQLRPVLFSISHEIKSVKRRKRTLESEHSAKDTNLVKEAYYRLVSQLPTEIRNKMLKNNVSNTSYVRDTSKRLFESTIFNLSGINGGNNSDKALECAVKGEKFLIPPNSRFLCGCVKEQCLKLEENKYNLLTADPPWWNKYIRRLKAANEKLSYSMMYNEEIAALPIKNLLSENALVAVWCTNSPSNISAVKDLIFPSWSVEYVTTWFWLKITTSCEPLCDFGTGTQKQPFERIIIGKVGAVNVPDSERVVLSVPSALHSHKPPLLDLLSPYLEEEKPQVLELFARYLLPNTTSVGYEPLKWQHISLYETVE